MRKFKNILRTVYFRLLSPNKVAKIVGVKYGNNCIFRTKNFGSEPYLIEIGDNVATSGNVRFITHDGSLHVLRNLYPEYKEIDLFGEIKIGNNVFIGIDAILLPGTLIGDNVIVGAGSVIRGTLESNSVYAGVPAKRISSLSEYVQKNETKFLNTHALTAQEKKKYLVSNK